MGENGDLGEYDIIVSLPIELNFDENDTLKK
jgi:hypothetical protein